MVIFFESGLNRGNSKFGVQNHNSHKNKNSNPVKTMSIADFVVLGVRPRYSHIWSECPRVEGDDEYTEMIRSLCFLVDCFDREGTAQEPNMETGGKYVRAHSTHRPFICPSLMGECSCPDSKGTLH
jgi:hypothetical protein